MNIPSFIMTKMKKNNNFLIVLSECNCSMMQLLLTIGLHKAPLKPHSSWQVTISTRSKASLMA